VLLFTLTVIFGRIVITVMGTYRSYTRKVTQANRDPACFKNPACI